MSLWVRCLQTNVAQNEVHNSFKDPWMVFKYVAVGLFLVILGCVLLREYMYYRWGIDCCRWGTRNSPGQEHQSADQRRAMASLEEEMAQKDMNARRQERRRKYEQFLAPYNMVIKSEHLYYAVDKTDGKREMHPLVSSNSAHKADNEHHEDHDEGIHGETDIEAAAAAANHNTNPELPHDVLIQISPNPDGEPRYVDGTCSICLLDYEVGDTIIRSTSRECHHAFHDDCILVWLSKGKKRCPICRNWFVPGSKIDDKKVIAHDAGYVHTTSPAGSNVVVADDDDEEEENDIEIDQLASSIPHQEGRDLVHESPPAASVSNHAAS